jgi:electron transfer flavoprotein alpha subunit
MYVYTIEYERVTLYNGKVANVGRDTATVTAKNADSAIAKLRKNVMKEEKWTDDETREKMTTTYKNFELTKLTRGDYIDY